MCTAFTVFVLYLYCVFAVPVLCVYCTCTVCLLCLYCVFTVPVLCVAAVVLDCVNMAPSAGKVTPKDIQFAAVLESRFPALPPRGALFQTLQDAKFDISGQSQKTVFSSVYYSSWKVLVDEMDQTRSHNSAFIQN